LLEVQPWGEAAVDPAVVAVVEMIGAAVVTKAPVANGAKAAVAAAAAAAGAAAAAEAEVSVQREGPGSLMTMVWTH